MIDVDDVFELVMIKLLISYFRACHRWGNPVVTGNGVSDCPSSSGGGLCERVINDVECMTKSYRDERGPVLKMALIAGPLPNNDESMNS